VKFATFQATAEAAFEAIPEGYRQGIDGLVVSRESVPHPTMPDIYTLGVCDTEAYPSDWSGPDTTRSVVVLYYGSFRNLARLDPDFDWEAEIHETIEHEIRHHLESLAGEDQLEDVDYAMDEDFKRSEGLDFDPWYYQRGDHAGHGTYVVEDHAFVERVLSAAAFDDVREIRFPWHGRSWAVERPDELGDVHYVLVEGVADAPATLELVLVRKRSWWEDVRRLLGSSRPRVLESEARARAVMEGG
jgi:hypothetical protein